MKKAAYMMTGALVLVMGTAGIVQAKGGPDGAQRGARMEMLFEEFDADKDGKITQAEIDAAKAARFAAADTDGDGFLTKEEATAYAEKMRAEREAKRRTARGDAMFDRLDADSDGKLSLEEANAGGRMDKMLDRLDVDEDGAVSRDELQAAAEKMRGKRGFGRDGRGHDHGRGGMERGEGRGAPW